MEPEFKIDVDPAQQGAAAAPRQVLLAGFTPPVVAALEARLGELDARLEVVLARDVEHTSRRFAPGLTSVLCIGPGLSPDQALELLRETSTRDPRRSTANVLLAAGSQLQRFQELVDDDRLFYLCGQPPADEDIARIVGSAAAIVRQGLAPVPSSEENVRVESRVLSLAARLAREPSLAAVARYVMHEISPLVDADRGACLIYDRTTETLWAPAAGVRAACRDSVAAGLVSFVVRTGRPLVVARVGADPRYEPEADNDRGPADQRLLAVPVALRGGNVEAVLVALRDGSSARFGNRERCDLELLAEQLAPILERLRRSEALERDAARRHDAFGGVGADVFRAEALDHYARGLSDQGHLIEMTPSWMRWAYRLVLGIVVVGILFAAFGAIDEYAKGIAVVRVEGLTDVTATTAGTITSVDVERGQTVAENALLVRFYGAQEQADLRRVQREFELGLLARLRAPTDTAVAQALGALRAQKELAEARLEARSVRAPRVGIVRDVRARPGQLVALGDVLLSLRGEDAGRELIALLPGRYRPLLEVGMPMRLELEGYRFAYQRLSVDAVSDEVFGPAEARRFLGPGIGDAVPLSGPVVLVRAALPKATFESAGRHFPYHDGILGRAEVRVRSESILMTLFPGLGALFDG